MRREFFLNEEETAYLDMLSPEWEAIKYNGQRWILIPKFPVPEGYTVKETVAAINIPLEYPVAQLDMVYFFPALKRKDGKVIGQTQCTKEIDGKIFQRWSRHYSLKNQWNPLGDSIITHIMAIHGWLEREFRGVNV